VPRAFISGTGLIGGSIGLGLGDAGWETLGWDPDEQRLGVAAEIGAVTPSDPSIVATLRPEDLIVLASPPRTVIETLPSLVS